MESVINFDLRRFRRADKMNQKEFAEALGVTQGFISRVENSGRNTPQSLMDAIENYSGWAVTPDIISLAMLKEQEEAKQNDAPVSDNGLLPLIPLEAIAGPGTPVFTDEQVQDYYNVREFQQNSDFLIRVKGDSMSPKFTGGDLVACKIVKEVLFFQYGRVYVLYTKSQGVMIKRLQPSGKEGYVTCVSDNEKYAPFDVPTEDIASLALVNGSISLE